MHVRFPPPVPNDNAGQRQVDRSVLHPRPPDGLHCRGLRRHRNLIAWAKERGLFVRVDRATPWGNPFELGKDGDRATVIAAYRESTSARRSRHR